MVANGTEGEPISAKDKMLLSTSPHLVLDGVVAAAEAVGAKEAIVCVERSATAVLRVLTEAIAERRAAHLDKIAIRLEATPARYVAGEASALVHWLNGGDARPTFVPTHLSDRGVGGRPTLVDNVETLAHVALIARHGAGWFRAAGTATDPGSALITVSGAVSRPGVYEVPLGVPLASVLSAAGAASVSAVLVGGYFGTWIAGSHVDSLTMDAASLGAAGASIGCGALAVLGAGGCGLAEAARVTGWLADQNAGQCGPCVLGLPAIAAAMDRLVAGDRSGATERDLRRWLDLVKGRGACRHPDGVARFVESSLRVFHDEIEAHRRRRRPCPPTIPRAPDSGPGGVAVSTAGGPTMTLPVNPIACVAHGVCAELFPERITLDEWGYPIIDPRPIPAHLLPHARRAVDACPTLALLVARSDRR